MSRSEIYSRLLEEILAQAILKCSVCGSAGKSYFRCQLSMCRKVRSLWNGTFFEQSKLSPDVILYILDMWLKGVSRKAIRKFAEIDKKTLYRLLCKVEAALVPHFYESLEKIGGNDTIVEADESKFGKRKYHRGHRVDGVWVLGMVERAQQRRIVLLAVPNRYRECLTATIQDHVHPSSIIYTDGWRGYNDVKRIARDHKTVNHSEGFVDLVTGVHTNTIEGCWAAIKAQVPVRDRTNSGIDLYLIRFMNLRMEICC